MVMTMMKLYVAALLIAVLITAPCPAETRLALISGVRHKAALDAVALAEVQLSALPALKLLERSTIDKVLKEHQLVFQGMADTALAIKTGKILTVDLLAVLEGDPKAKDDAAMGLVVFDARTGARLCDETLGTASGEEPAAAIVAAVEAAAAKYRARANGLKTVSIVGVRNVDMPIGRDTLCEAVARVLDRDLVASANVTVLEREHLEEVRRERAITPNAPADALLASLVTIQLEFERGGETNFKATALLVDPTGQKRRVTATINYDWSAGSVNSLLSGILAELHAVPSAPSLARHGAWPLSGVLADLHAARHTRKPDRKADAMRLIEESSFDRDAGRKQRAVACVEAALALAPDNPTVMLEAAGCLLDLRPCCPVLGTPSPDGIDEATAYFLHELDLAVRWHEYQGSHGGFKVSVQDMSRGGRIEERLGNNLLNLNQRRRELHLPASPSHEVAVRRYRHLMLGIVARQSFPRWSEGKFDAQYVQAYGLALQAAPLCFSNSKEWTDFAIDRARRVMQLVQRRGTLTGELARCAYSYVLLLSLITDSDNDFYRPTWQLSDEDLGRLGDLFEAMTQHASPSIQIFGRSSLLWLDMRRQRLDAEGMSRRAGAILDFARQKIQDSALPGGDRERAACYEAALNVVDISPQREVRSKVLDELLQLMLDRRELCSEVVRMAAEADYASPYGHYNCGFMTLAREVREARDPAGHLPKVFELLRHLSALAGSPRVRIIEGPKDIIVEVLHEKLTRLAREQAKLAGSHQMQRVDVRQLLSIGLRCDQPHPNGDALSRPVLFRDEIYVLQAVRSGAGDAPAHLDLLKIGMEGQSVRRISTLVLPPRPVDPNWLEAFATVWGRGRFPLRCPQICDDCLYCAMTDCGGIAVFPLDGGAPRVIARGTRDGQPLDIYDEIAVLGKRIFALTVGVPTYVHWYDPDHGGWQVIASSRRLEKKTPLDFPVNWAFGTTYDRYHDRVLFYVKDDLRPRGGGAAGVYQFGLEDHKISLLKACAPHRSVQWVGLVDPQRLWFGTSSTIDQYDMKADRWTEVFSLAVKQRPFAGITPPLRICPGEPEIGPPYVTADGWLWSFSPLARIAPDGAPYERLAAVDTGKLQDTTDAAIAFSNTLQYHAGQRALLLGQHNSISYLQLPKEPDPPPSRRAHPAEPAPEPKIPSIVLP